ncbi:MAG: cellulose binding domain-containing protein, partial [Oscillospiraceae bacterium]|nr:cellulose binding domain-containing protein [Oscillospiraceae bacterium]
MKRKIAMLISAVMVMSVFASCGGNGDSSSGEGTTESRAEATVTDTEAPDPIDFFGDNYDPFADDYDPYGGNGASAAKHTPETKDGDNTDDENTADDTDGEDTEQNNDEKSAEKNSSGGSSQNTGSTGSTGTTPAETTKNNTKTETAAVAKNSNTSSKKDSGGQTSNDVKLTLNSSNSWENGSDKYTQIDGSVKNDSDRAISGWTVTIPAASGVRVDQNWNCDISVNGGTLTVTPADYNSLVDAGSEGAFGMILCNAGSIDSSKATVKFGTTTVSGSNGGSQNNNNNNGGGNSSSVGNNNPKIVQAKDVPAPTTDDWLYTDGSKIMDKDGKEVWLTGVNWFGYNTGTNTFDGLWACDLNTSIAAIADRGFNLLRIPISTELIKDWSNGSYPNANFNQATNSYLVGMNSLEIFDYVIGQCRANGIK